MVNTSLSPFPRATKALGALGIVLLGFGPAESLAAGPLNCSSSYQIRQVFDNGAEWEMCWERRNSEGIVFADVHYTTETGLRRKVFFRAGLAQIHVPYDDDGERFHDVSDYGLGTIGTNGNLNNLRFADCPGGTRIYEGSRRVMCRSLHSGHVGSATGHHVRHGESLSLFSVSHVGAYNYIPMWVFFDDGTIEISMGATGQLQRYGDDSQHGWPVNEDEEPIGISHLHNYYWRLDFEIAEDGNDNDFVDVVEQIEFVPENSSNRTRAKIVTQFNSETAASISGETKRFWRVRDPAITNAEGAPVSYEIVMLETGHRDEGPSFEPFTLHDLYVTRYRPCEKFASHNPEDGSGCDANGDVSSFVDGESLVDEDVVVWVGITFHHIPRDEDEPFMHAHWNRFQIAPRDWTAGSLDTDFDGDGDPDSSDPDDDNDGMTDVYEIEHEFDQFDASDAGLDADNDGLTNLEEFSQNPGLDPNNPDTDGDKIGDAVDSDPVNANNGCTGGNLFDRTLETVVSANLTCAARETITVNPPTAVEPSGHLFLIAPAVMFKTGFESGSLTIISADGCPGCTP